MSINAASISGNLTRDPELRQTGSGVEVLNFSVAVNMRRRDAQGEWHDEPQFIDCTMWGARARGVAPYMAKGMKVAVQGKLKCDTWTDKETGRNRSKVSILVDEIDLMSRPQGGAQSAPVMQEAPMYDDSVPF